MAVIDTVAAGTQSTTHFVPAGTIITVTPSAGATATVMYTTQDRVAITNQNVTWLAWPKGAVTAVASDLAARSMRIRVQASGGSVQLSTNTNPTAIDLSAYLADFGGSAKYYTDSTGTIVGLSAPGGGLAGIGGGPVQRISGDTTVGSVLTAIPATGWAFAAGQWYRAGVAISGQTALTYTRVTADIGQALSFVPTNPVYSAVATATVAGPVIPVVTVPQFLGQVATGTFINDGTSANRYIGARSPHIMMKKGGTTGLRVVYGNWRMSAQVETDNTASQTYKTAIEYPAGTFTPVLYAGVRVGTAAPGANIVSDRASVVIPEGAKFWIRTLHDSGTNGQLFSYYTKDGTEMLQGSNTAGAVPDYVDGGGSWTAQTAGTQGTMLMPQAIVDDTTTPSVGLFGSSTPTGRGDITAPGAGIQGFMARAYGAKYPILNASLSGDSLQKFIASNSKRLALANYCSHIALSSGSNDIVGGRTAAQTAADAATVIKYFTDIGKPVAYTTVTDITTSTDAWATVENQTVGATESERLNFNTLVLAGLSGVTNTINALPFTESATVGKWKPNYTADGTHQATVSAIAAVPAVNVDALVFQVNSNIVTVLPEAMTTVSGAPVLGTDFDGASVLKLPNASNEFAVIADLPIGVKHDVFVNWTVSATPSALTPAVVNFAGERTQWTTSTQPTGTTRFYGLVPPQAAGTIERSQMPWSVTREDSDRIIRIRLGRRSDSIGGFVQIRSFEFVPTPDAVEATITNSGSITPTVFNTVYDGNAVLHGFSIYTPLRSSAAAVYLVDPVTIGGVQQSRLAKLDKTTYAMVQDVQIGTNTHDTTVGHRDGSVVVTDSGKVICHPEAHHVPWAGKIALTEDLTTLAAMTAPAGLDTNCSYRRFFRNPFDNSIWMCARGNSYAAAVYKFNESTNVFDRKPAGTMLAGDTGSFLGSYGMELAFGSANTIYVTTEFEQGSSAGTASGYPRQTLSVIKSVDGGTTWQTMRGKALQTPIVQNSIDDDIAFASNNQQNNGVYTRLAVGADGQPILVACWLHPSDATRSLWVAKWNDTAKKWIRRRIFRPIGGFDVGNPHVAYFNGKIVVSISTTDDHTPGSSQSGGAGERVPGNNNILLFVTTDNASTWRRYDINHVAAGYGGAYIDGESMRIDNKLRLRPVNESAPTTSVIWEMPVPA